MNDPSILGKGGQGVKIDNSIGAIDFSNISRAGLELIPLCRDEAISRKAFHAAICRCIGPCSTVSGVTSWWSMLLYAIHQANSLE